MTLEAFPALNASLNGASAVFLMLGYGFIKARRYTAHASMMISAVVTSTAFLACYLTYHALRAKLGITITRFPESSIRPVYKIILLTHTVLAAVIVPLVLVSLWRAYRRQWARHRRISFITLPIWLYVSVTGVVIYWMLYHLAPTLDHSR